MDYSKYQNVQPSEITYNLDTAMPFGEMPNSALVKKFEETADLDDGEDAYENYSRKVAQDFSPDPPSLAQNEPRKSFASKGILNVLHSGGRGEFNSPAHPEMFLSFTDKDPRGSATDPDFRKLTDQENARMRFVRFSADADNSVHQGVPTQSAMYRKSRYDTHKQVRSRAKIFSTSRDGRREGMRRDTYDHASVVNKVEEDINAFRPQSKTFSDYITDAALTPMRKTTKLSNTILTNSNLYHQFTTDHEFKVSRYGESTRTRKTMQSTQSRVDSEGLTQAPSASNEDTSRAYKAAGILMGALVKQKHISDNMSRGGVKDQGNTLETMAARKTSALTADLNKIMQEQVASTEMKVSAMTQFGKVATPQQAEHLTRVVRYDSSKPAHLLHNAEIMYKSISPGADLDLIRREIIVDDRKAPQAEQLTISGKSARTDTLTGTRVTTTEVSVDGKSLSPITYKTGRASSTNRATKSVAATTENFAGKSDQTIRGKTSLNQYRTHDTRDDDGENQFFHNLEQKISINPMGIDKSSVRRMSEASHVLDGVSSGN